MKKETLFIQDIDPLHLLGSHDEILTLIEDAFPDVKLVVRGNNVSISGEDKQVDSLKRLFEELIFIIQRNKKLNIEDARTVIDLVQVENGLVQPEENLSTASVIFSAKKGDIKTKTPGQLTYMKSAVENDIVFVIGPAGTGKTYLAVALALDLLNKKEVSRLILTRPAIEAGENLGYLPGDLMEKVDPYLRPLTDALFSMLPAEQLQRYMERKIIEIVPLAYMRGRTLNKAFVILDEAQNTVPMQMKMFLTRLGVNSKAIITGDVTQSDLADSQNSGLIQIQKILKEIDGIGFVYLNKSDVVRHQLVKKIIHAYEVFYEKISKKGNSE